MKVMEDVGGTVRTDGSWHEATCLLDGRVVVGAKGIRPLMGHVTKNLNQAAVGCLYLLFWFLWFLANYYRNSLLQDQDNVGFYHTSCVR